MNNKSFPVRASACSDHVAPPNFLRRLAGKASDFRQEIDRRGENTFPKPEPNLRRLTLAAAAVIAAFFAAPATAQAQLFWDGRTDALWTDANWATTASDAQTTQIPTASTDVTFSVLTGAQRQNTTLGVDFTIHSLTINDPTAVTIGGPKALTVSGASGITGITVNSGAGLLTINADLTLIGPSNTITVNNTAGVIINSTVSGPNGLVKLGPGLLTLTQSSAYTGPTIVNGGTLLITGVSNTTNIGTTSYVAINSGGTVSIVGDNNYLGFVATSQTTNIAQGGTLTMGAQNAAHVGPIALVGGTLATTGSPGANAFQFGTFNLDHGVTAGGIAATSTISAQYVVLTQPGGTVFNVRPGAANGVDLNVTGTFNDASGVTNFGLIKQGAGLMLLSGANTYAEATTISAGTLQFAKEVSLYDGTPASVSKVAVAGGATIAFNVGGAGEFTAADLNTIQANSTGFANGARLGLDTTNAAGGVFTYSSPITDANGGQSSMGLIKLGLGTLTLSGINSYTGDTLVNQGSLLVDGSIASPNTTVAPGALLGGRGVLGGNLNNSGVVSPGDSPGLLTVRGNYSQSASGALLIQVAGLAPAQHDLLAVGGSASLGGALQLQQLNGFQLHLGDKVTFLTAGGGISGAFATVDPFATGTLIGVDVVYLSNSVLVEGAQLPFTSIPHETQNQRAVADALQNSYLDRRNALLVAHLDNEPIGKVLGDLDRIAPEELTSIYQIAISQSKIQTANLQRRLEDVRSGSNGFSSAGLAMNGGAPPQSGTFEMAGPTGSDGKEGKAIFTPTPENRWGVFVTGTGDWASVGDTGNSHGYDLTNAGFTLGVDYKVTDNFVIGLATGYDHSTADLTSNGRVIVDGGKLALYSSYFTGKGFYADVAVQGGYNGYDTHRSALDGSAIGSADGGELNVLFGTGYDWKVGGLTFGPTGNFDYTYVGLDSFGERGSLAPLDFSSQHQESIRSTFGAKISYDWKLAGMLIKPELRAGWQHEYGDATLGIDSSFADGAGPSFLTHGPSTGRDSLLLSAGFAVQLSERVSTYVYYDGELARTNYQANSVSGGFRFDF